MGSTQAELELTLCSKTSSWFQGEAGQVSGPAPALNPLLALDSDLSKDVTGPGLKPGCPSCFG